MKTKYVLVDRGSDYKDTYVTSKVAADMVERGIASSYTTITLKEIKARKLHCYDEATYFRHRAEDDLIVDWDGKHFQAMVCSFDRSRGEGLVKLATGEILDIYACNIQGKRTWYPETACVYYTEGQTIDIEIKVFLGGKIFVNGLTLGTLDAEKWNALDKEKLAFKCNDKGEAINGLFG